MLNYIQIVCSVMQILDQLRTHHLLLSTYLFFHDFHYNFQYLTQIPDILKINAYAHVMGIYGFSYIYNSKNLN